MYYIPKVNDSTYYLGVNDRTKHLFENLWPLPAGVAYNSYLIKDEKNVLIDTVDICYADRFLQNLDRILGEEPLHYLIVDHMEPDHSGSIRVLKHKYPDIQFVVNKKSADMLRGYFDITDNVVIVDESTKLNIGSRELQFIFAPMVHWPEVMFTYDSKEKVLFSADAFGSFGTLDGGIFDEEVDRKAFYNEVYRYYSNIVGKYGSFTQKAIAKCAGLEIGTICATHGPVWRKYAEEIIALYNKLSKDEWEVGATIIYGSMYGHTEEVAEVIGRSLAHHGVKNVVLCNASTMHPSYILSNVFRYKAVVLGCPTYNNGLYPVVETAMNMIESRGVKGKLFACFGSYTWNGAAVKNLKPFAETMKWQTLEDNSVEIQMEMKDADIAAAWDLGKRLAEQLLNE
ncbi:MAG: FprA family A-type flavoprotein [Porphyromonas sp.]|nr:FprA family A-type flavoprotein [Porphyromonas sp.]